MEQLVEQMELSNIQFVTPANSTTYFDEVIGHIEDIVVSDEFQNAQKNFLEQHYQKFENTDENKLEYTTIFTDYTNLIEHCILCKLRDAMPDFDLEKFREELNQLKPTLEGEIFEMLFSLTDFVAFKELMLDYKASKEGIYKDIGLGITVTKLSDDDDDEDCANTSGRSRKSL